MDTGLEEYESLVVNTKEKTIFWYKAKDSGLLPQMDKLTIIKMAEELSNLPVLQGRAALPNPTYCKKAETEL